MTALFIVLSLLLLLVVIFQVAKINQLAADLTDPEFHIERTSNTNGKAMLLFGVVFLGSVIWSAMFYANRMLGYGPLKSASEHGYAIDSMFNMTLLFTGIIFVICHILLFWFAYRYRYTKGRKVLFFVNDNRLELLWTAVPALVLTILIIKGLVTWNEVMADVKKDEAFLEVEATGWQFAWNLRYPGKDGKLGVKDFRMIRPGVNELGQDWTDVRNHDDFNADELVLPKGKKVRVRITARDVLHNFYLPHFRVKMDAVPGIPTYFIFTPVKTTDEFRQELRKYPEYQMPSDPADPNSKLKWETFNYELACAELCGKGHYSMRRVVRVVSPEEWEVWNASQKSHYLTNVRHSDDDPFKGQPLESEALLKAAALKDMLANAFKSGSADDAARTLQLDNVYFETGSAALNKISDHALEILYQAFVDYPNLSVEISGHTDSTGDANANISLSEERAVAVKSFLTGRGIAGSRIATKGLGPNRPVAENDTEEGRRRNRRIEFKILKF